MSYVLFSRRILTKSRYNEILIGKCLVFPYLKQSWRRWRWQTLRRHTLEYKCVSLPWWHAQMYYCSVHITLFILLRFEGQCESEKKHTWKV